jgi:hypothetical protein
MFVSADEVNPFKANLNTNPNISNFKPNLRQALSLLSSYEYGAVAPRLHLEMHVGPVQSG